MDDADAETGRGKARPVSYATLGEAERGVIDQAFEAFAWRAKPAAVVSEREVRAGASETVEVLTGVAARDVGDELFDAAFPQPLFVSLSLTPEANLYYMPTVISRCVRETESDSLAHDVLALFRSRPYNLDWPISAWPRFMDAAAGDEDALADPHVAEEVDECGRGFLMEKTRYWLMVTALDRAYGRTWHDTLHLVAQMTPAERQALVAFFRSSCDRKHLAEGPQHRLGQRAARWSRRDGRAAHSHRCGMHRDRGCAAGIGDPASRRVSAA